MKGQIFNGREHLGQLPQSVIYSILGLLVVAISVSVSLFLSFEIYAGILLAICGLLILTTASLYLVHHQTLGLLVLIGSAFVPVLFGPRLNFTFLLAGYVIAVWLFDLILNRRKIGFLFDRTSLPLLFFIAVASVSFLTGQFSWFPGAGAPLEAQAAGLGIFWFSAAAFLITADKITSERLLQRIVWLFFLFGGLQIVLHLVPGCGQLASPFLESGSMGCIFWTWLVALAFAQAVFNRHLSGSIRLILGLLVLLALFVGLFQNTSWVSGWLPPLVALAAIIFARSPRVGIYLGTISLFGLPFVYQRAHDLIMLNESYSYMTRVEAWKTMVEIIRVNPILGFGPANYHFYTPFQPILGWYIQFSSHNNYIDIVAQTGILGLFCFLWFLLGITRLGWGLREQLPSGFTLAYVYGAIGGLAGTVAAGMLADWFLPFVYNIGVNGFRSSILAWIFLGSLLAIDRGTRVLRNQPLVSLR